MSRWTVSVSSGDDTLVVGQLFTHQRRERMSSSFRYEPGWLAAPQAYALEPAMSLSAGDYAVSRGLPRSIRDAAPDRWGRNLIEKRLRAQWAAAGDFPRRVTELDYLLGVSDHTRQGALRFSLADGPFLAEGQEIPKLVALPKLLAASRRVAMNNLSGDAGGAVIQTDGAAAMAAVKTLLDAGTASLGGARPKAALEIDGHLFIAKFPHPADR
ncbi:MAG: HipA N-terminal domain-containing protein, partial [Actinomycetes bacterium]|nr:HipA N-terminal domain-containing protein [Actinomycetes bacterium]